MPKAKGATMCPCIHEERDRVVIDFAHCGSRQVSDTYQDFGILCAHGKVRAVLVKTSDEQADQHYALRDVLATVVRVAGIALRFRLALVAGSDSIETTYRSIQDELRSLGCETRIFRAEGEAKRWLGSAKSSPARSSIRAAMAS